MQRSSIELGGTLSAYAVSWYQSTPNGDSTIECSLLFGSLGTHAAPCEFVTRPPPVESVEPNVER